MSPSPFIRECTVNVDQVLIPGSGSVVKLIDAVAALVRVQPSRPDSLSILR